jgi:hypothetical protein
MALCGEHTLQGEDESLKAVGMAYCGTWDCETCGPRRLLKLWHEIIEGEPDRLLTLTNRPRPGVTACQWAKAQAKHWAAIRRQWLSENPGKACPFFAVREAHKSGWPHLHIAIRGTWIDQAWLKARWEERTGDFKVDIRKFGNGKEVARYISKYIGKAPARFGTAKRYWHSKDWAPKKKDEAWTGEELPFPLKLTKQSWKEALDATYRTNWHMIAPREGLRLFYKPSHPQWALGP